MTKPGRGFIQTLENEAEKWLKQGIIDRRQKDRILGQYEAFKVAEDKGGPSKLIATISVLGSILVGIGVLLFVASNWSQIPNSGRLAIIFTSMLASYGSGFIIRYERQTFPRVGAGLILLGSIIFGAGIFLVAQMYHITVHYPNGPLLWGLAVLPLAYLLGLNAVLSLAIIDLLVWLGMEASFSMSFSNAYGSFTVFVSLFLLAGITLWVLGLMHQGLERLAHHSGPYLSLGPFVTFLSGYLLTFEFLPRYFRAAGLNDFYYGLAFLFSAALAVFIVKGKKGQTWLAEMVFLVGLFLLVLLFALFSPSIENPYVPNYANEYMHHGQDFNTMRLGLNLLYALQVIGVIVLGYIRRNRAYINIGLVFFVLEVIARYFDFFWKLLPRSLFFIGGGLLLMACAIFLEKKRRKILASFNVEAG